MDTLDQEIHARFIVERVMTRGGRHDWQTLLELYGKERVRDEAVTIRCLDPRTVHYLMVYFDLAESAFRCSRAEQLYRGQVPGLLC